MINTCAKIVGEVKLDKIEVVLRRVETLLREITQVSNHGEITIRVTAGRIYVTGGPETEIK